MAGLCGISRGFPRLSPTTGQVPTRYSPVRHSCQAEARHAFDLHVLSMPPAFVLSQDQTLMFNPDKPAALSDSRPVVHRPGPRTETRPNQGPPNAQNRMHPPPHSSHRAPAIRIPSARPAAQEPPPAYPFIIQQCQSATPRPSSPLRGTGRRGRTLIWPPPTHRQPPFR